MVRKVCIRLGALLLFVLPFAVTGCKDKKVQQESTLTGFELTMTGEDTTAVADLVNQFFEQVEAGLITDAVAMLYQLNDSDRYNKVELLDNENIANVTQLLRSFPIVSHRIDYIKFHEVYANEVKVTAVIEEAADGMPELKTAFYFRPVDDLGRWRLCLMNSASGDRRIISNAEADSVSAQYADYQKETEAAGKD